VEFPTVPVLVMDKAGWRVSGRLKVLENISIVVHLPAYALELHPVEPVWLHLKQRYLSYRVFANTTAITDACAKAWNDLLDKTGRLTSLTDYHALKRVRT
jgi:hypothetical protein